MTDFMKWLYANYIKPQLDQTPREEHEMWFSLLESDLCEYQMEAWEKTREFYSIYAFLLGMRTGAGLEHFR